MSLFRLILQEMQHRKINFLLGLVSVVIAVACLVAALTLLQADEIQTAFILEKKADEVKEAGDQLEDAMRKITKGLGFNILILPSNQDLNEFHLTGIVSGTMPEENVKILAESKIVTVNHLLPMVAKKITWPEKKCEVILTGTRGEVPLRHRALKKPLQQQVPKGTMVMGYQIQQKLGLNVNDKVKLMGKDFKITQCYPERGTADDSTVWINLEEAQELLKMQNLVNAILALECNCAAKDRVAQIREEIGKILPGTQIIERGPPALARAEARNQAHASAVASLEQEKANRLQMIKRHADFAAVLVPLVVLGCGAWIGFLSLENVRRRAPEIGVLRAIGLRSTQVFGIFIIKAFLIGVIGALIGYFLGYGIGITWGSLPASVNPQEALFSGRWLLLSLIFAPVLASLSSWIPALLAARQDPATILQEG
ncbi:MAG: FtsX-like permease family protein [Planctomycetes bacterium]|nr:FtsX-like permease family protein [Planctomycetota bacterium]MCH9727005.1 FtsX-like permease family protein [Planctomycetota bacterium]MCH9775205.1 FtsX-like permease family protein [Planctomycetota bacterium]MDF1745617.1 FtsX-like permease family protein [Gimesia sp.]